MYHTVVDFNLIWSRSTFHPVAGVHAVLFRFATVATAQGITLGE